MSAHLKTCALVTGASRGIGAAIARRLAANGWSVVVHSSPVEDRVKEADRLVAELRSCDQNAELVVGDLGNMNEIQGIFDTVEKLGFTSTALVLNAASRTRGGIMDTDLADWQEALRVNISGTYLCVKAALPNMIRKGSGAIVTVSSVTAVLGHPGTLAYNTSKSALVGLTRSLAREVGKHDIRVNCLMPGSIHTEEELTRYPDQTALITRATARQSLPRRGTAAEVASAAAFLVGSDSSFITGQTLCVDGGWTYP